MESTTDQESIFNKISYSSEDVTDFLLRVKQYSRLDKDCSSFVFGFLLLRHHALLGKARQTVMSSPIELLLMGPDQWCIYWWVSSKAGLPPVAKCGTSNPQQTGSPFAVITDLQLMISHRETVNENNKRHF